MGFHIFHKERFFALMHKQKDGLLWNVMHLNVAFGKASSKPQNDEI